MLCRVYVYMCVLARAREYQIELKIYRCGIWGAIIYI